MTPERELHFIRLKLKAVEEENDILRESLRQLSDSLKPGDLYTPIEWGLTVTEEQLLLFMLHNTRLLSTTNFMTAVDLYLSNDREIPDPKVLHVNIHRIRKKLDDVGFGDCVKNVHGRGYAIEKSNCALILSRLLGG